MHVPKPLLLTLLFHSLVGAAEPEGPTFFITPVTGRTFLLTEKGFLNDKPFLYASPFSSGLAAVQDRESELFGYINGTGKLVLPYQWRSVGVHDSHTQLAQAQDKDTGLWGYIDTQGRWAIPPTWDQSWPMTQARATPVKKGRKWGLISMSGEVLVEPQWDEASQFWQDTPPPHLAPFRVGTQWGYVRSDGSIAVPPRYTGARVFVECGLARVQQEGRWGFINAEGKLVISPQWSDVGAFRGPKGSARAAVKSSKGKWGFIDEAGTLVIPHRYDDIQGQDSAGVGPFSYGRASVQIGKLWGVIDLHGKELLPCEWDHAGPAGPGQIWHSRKVQGVWHYGLQGTDGEPALALSPQPGLLINDKSGCWATYTETATARAYTWHTPDGRTTGPFSLSLDFQPSPKPQLRIEAGMHSGIIWRVATDQRGRIALTCGNDKTARLWALPASADGKATHLRTLRIPIGAGIEGKLVAAALSPDGSVVAVAGNSGQQWDGNASVYIFDVGTGALLRRLSTPTAAGISSLSFSASGNIVATGHMAGNGLRVWDVTSGRLLAKDSDYDGDCWGLGWNGDRCLASTDEKGFIRLYNLPDDIEPTNLLTPARKVAATSGLEPYAITFSPDGKELAVGYEDKAVVSILSADDLRLLHQPNTKGISNGSLCAVSWSNDGRKLAAGGGWAINGSNPIRVWSEAGRGAHEDVPLSADTLFHLCSLPSGGFLYAAADPSWGLLPAGKDRIKELGKPPITDHRGGEDYFRLAPDATTVGFCYRGQSDSPVSFDIIGRRLRMGGFATEGLRKPRRDQPGMKLTNWLGTKDPKLNGQSLGLLNETSRCYAFGPPGAGFVLGSHLSLRSFDSLGLRKWALDVPGEVWAVNQSEMGKLVVAAYGDGTIRWHRNDLGGMEVLAFFPHADKKRWVLWTPEGYYDCSPGGQDLIGWHVNRRKDEAADFFPCSQFAKTFYRPDVIDELLSTWDTKLALAAADAKANRRETPVQRIEDVMAKMQPPVIELVGAGDLTPQAGSVTLSYRVRHGSSALTRMRLLMDGRPINTPVTLPSDEKAEASTSVPVPQEGCLLALLAENSTSVSVPATLRVPPTTLPPSAAITPPVLKPSLYILSVGVSDYSDVSGLRDLGLAAKDAQDLASAFKQQEGLLYQKVELRVLTDKEATATNIKDGLDWVRQQTTAKDVCAILLAGHGDNDNQGHYFFCPHDFDNSRRLSTTVGFDVIKETVSTLPGKVLFFIDTCHAGNALGKMVATRSGSSGPDINRIANELSGDENGAVVFSSSTGRQLSQEKGEWGNGAFTKAVVEGINGEADLLKNGKITIASLETYVAERVKTLTGGEQTPTVAKPQNVPDFTISIKK